MVNRYKSLRKAGKSKSAHMLVNEIVAAIEKLINVGHDIGKDFPEIAEEMNVACHDTKEAGKVPFTSMQDSYNIVYHLTT